MGHFRDRVAEGVSYRCRNTHLSGGSGPRDALPVPIEAHFSDPKLPRPVSTTGEASGLPEATRALVWLRAGLQVLAQCALASRPLPGTCTTPHVPSDFCQLREMAASICPRAGVLPHHFVLYGVRVAERRYIGCIAKPAAV